MKLTDLITLAAKEAGSLGKLAEEMGKHQNRLTEWKKGDRKPDASEIAFLAERVGLPVLQTVADIEAQLDSRYASVWKNALGKLAAAGVAATVGTVVVMTPQNANASPSQALQAQAHSVYYVNSLRRQLASSLRVPGRDQPRYRLTLT